MKKALIAAAALGGLLAFAAPAFAADPIEPDHDWTGFYLGAHVGYGWGDSDNDASNGAFWSTDIEGVIGGIHAGYNIQMDGLVLGLEGDIDLSDIDGRNFCPNPAFRCETEVEWVGTIRARAGFAVDQLLIFATGGVAFTDADFTNINAAGVRVSDGDGSVGFVVGGGAEVAVSESFSVRAEALYYDFDSFDFAWANDGGVTYDSELNFIVVRGGLTLHF